MNTNVKIQMLLQIWLQVGFSVYSQCLQIVKSKAWSKETFCTFYFYKYITKSEKNSGKINQALVKILIQSGFRINYATK